MNSRYKLGDHLRWVKAAMRVCYIGLWLLLLLCSWGAAPSWAGEAIVNSEINVDIASKDAGMARSQAMAKAEVDGLKALLERLGPPDQARDIMGTLDSKQISGMVKGTEIVHEEITENRYRARMIVSFDGDQISNLMSGVSAPEAQDTMPASVGAFLIIPGLEFNSQKLLWEQDNIWKSVWNEVALEIPAGDVLVPYGDQKDKSSLSYDAMMNADFQALSNFTVRYGASDVVLLQGKYTMRPDMMLSVTMRRVTRQDENISVHTYRADPQETREMLLIRACRDLVAELQAKKLDETANRQSVRGGDRKKVMMLASILTMASWTDLRKKISALPMVDRLETIAVSPRQVDLVVYYRGSEESFTNALRSTSVRLQKKPEYWAIAND